MPTLTGNYATAHASKYLQQLCKHFGHKVDVSYDIQAGTAALPVGPTQLIATDDALSVVIALNDAGDADRAKFILDSHLEKFAFREEFTTMDRVMAD